MRKIFLLLAGILFLSAGFAGPAYAVCPVCVAVAGAGLGISRWLGIDDAVSSIWIGGLLVSLSAWTIIWFGKKEWNFKCDKIIIPLAYYLVTIVPLYYYNIIGLPWNKIFGVDKIIFGVALGTIVFLAGIRLHIFLKEKNRGKQFFSYQKVILPVFLLLVVSLAVFLLV